MISDSTGISREEKKTSNRSEWKFSYKRVRVKIKILYLRVKANFQSRHHPSSTIGPYYLLKKTIDLSVGEFDAAEGSIACFGHKAKDIAYKAMCSYSWNFLSIPTIHRKEIC